MGNLKPIGSEKLTGDQKLKRIMEIARFNEVIPSRINETAKSEYSIGLADGNKYEIVKERQGYIIKKTISESETDYIEPMKNRKYYSSYSQAFKRLNLVAGELNRLNENEEGLSLYGEQKKFTLKTPKPQIEAPSPASVPSAPPAVPSPELPPSPIDDMGLEDDMSGLSDTGVEDFNTDIDVDMDVEDNGNGDSNEKVTFKSIQKLTGKLTQKIRTLESQEGLTSEDIKYVINMVLSSFELNELSEEDREDILSKFEDETEDLGGDDMDGEDLTDDSEVEDIDADMDIPMEGEIDEDMYGSFGNLRRKDSKGDTYYDEKDRTPKDSDLYGIGGDDYDTEEFDTFQKLYDKYGDKQRWFGPNDGEKMFNTYKNKTGKPFKVKTRKPMEGEMGESSKHFGSFDDEEWTGDDNKPYNSNYFDFDFDEEEFDNIDSFRGKHPDMNWFEKGGRDSDFFNKYKKQHNSPLKVRTRKSDFGNGAIFDSIFGESKVDKVLSKYFEVSKKEIVENRQKITEKKTKSITEVRRQMKSVIKLTETIEQELASQKFLEENSSAKIIGKTNKNNLVFENKGKEIKITPEGLLV